MMMKGFSLVPVVFIAVLAALVVSVALIALDALAVSAALIVEVAVVVVVAMVVAVVAVVATVIVVAAEVAAEADRISLAKKYCKLLHFDVEAILIEMKHKGQITVHKMLIMLLKDNGSYG
jgi:hypothetical protein